MSCSIQTNTPTFMVGLHLKASDSRNSCSVRLVGPSFSPLVTGMMAKAATQHTSMSMPAVQK